MHSALPVRVFLCLHSSIKKMQMAAKCHKTPPKRREMHFDPLKYAFHVVLSPFCDAKKNFCGWCAKMLIKKNGEAFGWDHVEFSSTAPVRRFILCIREHHIEADTMISGRVECCLNKHNNGSFSWLFSQIRRRIPSLLVLMGSNMLGAYLGAIFAVSIQKIIDSAVNGDLNGMIRQCVILSAIILIRVVCSALSIHLSEMIRANLDRDMKQSIIHKILHSEFSQISQYHSGDLVNRMNSDVHNAYNGVLAILSSTTSLVTSLVTTIAILMGMAPGFTVAIVSVSAVVAAFTLLIQKHLKEIHKDASAANGKVSGFFQEIIAKLLIIQALDVSGEIEKRSDVVLETRWQIQRKRKNVALSINLGSSGLSYVGSFVTLVWCAFKLHNGEITFGELTAMTALIGQLQTPMLTLPALIPKVTSISAACERLMEIIHIPEQPSGDLCRGRELYDNMTGITAKGLSFAYDRDPVFRNVSLTIPKGGLTVITGPSGIGKSTLLKLLLGIYQPAKGSLVVDTDSGEIPVSRAVRPLFSYAPQGNLLLSGTLRENILLANPEATEEALRNALYVSAMDDYVSSLPQGLDTVLGENGAGLSEGQSQRISLARAVLTDAPVLLLDEVTSALDAETERIVLERICALPNKTCIAVTHRPAALALATWQISVSENNMTILPMDHAADNAAT